MLNIEWRSMGTAPTDGTQILCYNPVMGVYSTSYTKGWKKRDGSVDLDYRGFPCGQIMGMLGQWDCAPFCWAEIPPAPTTDTLFDLGGYKAHSWISQDSGETA